MFGIRIILAIYMLFLSLAPCADVEAHNDSTVTIQTASDDCTQDMDLCSPFCTCSCCVAGIAFLHDDSRMDFQPFLVQEKALFNYSCAGLEPSVSIWQPPKLS